MNIKDFILGYLIGKQDGGGGSSVEVEPLTVTENGEYSEEGVAYSPVTVNVAGGGGGLEYEEGIFEPNADIARPTISFTNPHSASPAFVLMADIAETAPPTADSNLAFSYSDWNSAFGITITPNASPITNNYGMVYYLYMANTRAGVTITKLEETASNNSRAYWVDKTGFYPSSASNSRYWKSGRKYKWIAIWMPES